MIPIIVVATISTVIVLITIFINYVDEKTDRLNQDFTSRINDVKERIFVLEKHIGRLDRVNDKQDNYTDSLTYHIEEMKEELEHLKGVVKYKENKIVW